MATFRTIRHFDTSLLITRADEASEALGKEYWVMTQPFVYYVGVKGSNITVEVPAGYLTDGATIPPAAYDFIRPWGKHGQACALHDYLCEYLTVKIDGLYAPITRAMCDRILLEAMEVLDVSLIKRYIMYWSVCLWRIINNINHPKPVKGKRAWEELYRDKYGIVQPSELPSFQGCWKTHAAPKGLKIIQDIIADATQLNKTK
jgi:hypothetical protein